MMDWMVEVCSSFKCTTRTYFLATAIFDRYIAGQGAAGKKLVNKDVHSIGVTSMYLASKYEDIYPLHSRIVSEKIAHKAISAPEILKREQEFLKLFDYEVDFVTHFDFYQTLADKLKRETRGDGKLVNLICEMSLLLIKQAIQNVEFTKYSPSAVVASSFYASTCFLKRSKDHESPTTTQFVTDFRKNLFTILFNDQ